jgi:transcriptional regulator with GAF, ATPase, and Fis domain
VISLQVLQGSAAGQVFEFDVPSVTMGRQDGNQLVLADALLSGEHGQLFQEEDQVIYRDLRSTNGSSVQRGDRLIPVDATCQYEITLHDGDKLLLGDPKAPVVLAVRLPEGTRPAAETRVLESRPIAELPVVTEKLERDPAFASALLKAGQRLSRRVELVDTLEALTEAVFELLPKVTHVALWMGSDTDEDRFTVAMVRERGRAASASPPEGGPLRASRTVLRRVLAERAAVHVADAASEMGAAESIIAGRIKSTLAAPLWHGEKIRGVVQVDNRASAGMFQPRDLDLLMVLGAQASLALDNALLVQRLRFAEERLRGENKYLKEKAGPRRFTDIIGQASSMRAVLAQLEKVIDTRATVCIEGETGTGKELIASAVHYQGRRRDKLFVAQNCAALPETLLESELFGHKKGSFTGADHDKKGLFELADGGTLFLDEIGEMTLGLQAKLLRALQEGTVRPVGAAVEKQVDVRIICATNRNLAAEVQKGTFRQDLFYRLMVFPIRLPPLRERRDDIPLLAEHFLRKYTQEYRKPVQGFAQATQDAMCAYAWPGNIRELENEVQRMVIQSDTDAFVEPESLSPQIRKVEGTLARIAPKKGTLKDMMDQVERWLLSEALRDHQNNKTRTAETLGITREGLHKKLSKFGMG